MGAAAGGTALAEDEMVALRGRPRLLLLGAVLGPVWAESRSE